MASLVAISGAGSGKRYGLEKECVFGRSFNCDVVVGELAVSRRHARVRRQPGNQYLIEDLGSGNGTFVNDERVTQRLLQPRDVIRIGGTQFRFEGSPPTAGGLAADVQTMMANMVQLEGITVPQSEHTIDASVTGPMRPGAGGLSAVGTDFLKLSEAKASAVLRAMIAVSDVVASEVSIERLLEKILDHLLAIFPQSASAYVLLKNEKTGELIPEAIKRRETTRAAALGVSQTMIHDLMDSHRGIIRPSSSSDSLPPPHAHQHSQLPAAGVTAKMGAPLICRNHSLGTILVEARDGQESFSEGELLVLTAVARQAALAITNARAGQALMDQKRLDDDLALARKIQRSFLPTRLPNIPGLDLQAHYVPAQKVGGDFYDIIQLDRNRVAIHAGDISGKGIGAALVAAKVASDIRLFCSAHLEPRVVLSKANNALLESGQDIVFATVALAVVDLADQTLTLANAGHQPPIVATSRHGGISELNDPSSVALGVMPDVEYDQRAYSLMAGDIVLMYTDGINEAMNRQRIEYGMENLLRAIGNGPAEASLIVERVVNDVRRFVGGAQQSDDQTLVAFGLPTGLAVTR
jgi:serine phosphatase RsbU (regulator of sigma subunit)